MRFADGYSSGRLQRKIVILGAVLGALLSGNRLVAGSQPSTSLSPATMPPIATIDDHFESYNVEMAEVIWLGQTQPRVVKIENDTLHLSTVSPIHSGGKLVNSYLQWKKAEKG